jgi:tetratricopeptide (TPR) repeat protein
MVMEPDFNQRAGLVRETAVRRRTGAVGGGDPRHACALEALPGRWFIAKNRVLGPGEFLAYVKCHRAGMTKSIAWVPGSYSKAWYQLAAIAVEEERFQEALVCLDWGLGLEPDHPELWSEKGFVLGMLKRHAEALECYVKAAQRDWAPASQIARAVRGQGRATHRSRPVG